MRAKLLIVSLLIALITAFSVVPFSTARVQAISPISTPSGDANGDGKVDIQDLSIVLSNWGTDESSCDFNHDSVVNVLDLSIVLSNWTPEEN